MLWNAFKRVTEKLPEDQKDGLFYENARRVYGIEVFLGERPIVEVRRGCASSLKCGLTPSLSLPNLRTTISGRGGMGGAPSVAQRASTHGTLQDTHTR